MTVAGPQNTYMTHAHLGGQHCHWQQMSAEFLPTILCSVLSYPDSVLGHVELRLLAETWHLELIELLLRYLEFLLKILENHVTFGHYVDLIQ